MQIHSLQNAQATQSVQSTQAARGAEAASDANGATSAQQADQLDLSPEALAIGEAQAAVQSEVSGVRSEKVAAIKQAIADGTYETPEKLSAALDKMLDSFA
jgi:negative regulator of flagellin synthesis FlgM